MSHAFKVGQIQEQERTEIKIYTQEVKTQKKITKVQITQNKNKKDDLQERSEEISG